MIEIITMSVLRQGVQETASRIRPVRMTALDKRRMDGVERLLRVSRGVE